MSQHLPISFTRQASKQVEEAAHWWRANREKAPAALTEEIDQALQLIASQPDVGGRARNAKLVGVRRILLNRLGYHVSYRVVEAPTRSIQVVAVWHASRGTGPRL